MTRQEIIIEARKLLGVPFKHQGRNPLYGLDCVGILIVIAEKAGIKVKDSFDYDRWAAGVQLLKIIENHGLKRVEKPLPGDILVFRIKKYPQHVGIMTDKGFIHAYEGSKRVIECSFTPKWQKRFVGAFKLGE